MNSQRAALINLGVNNDGPSLVPSSIILEVVVPATASLTTVSSSLDTLPLQHAGNFNLAALFTLPAFTTTQLPDTKTLTCVVQACADPLFGSGIVAVDTLVITGAGGIGAKATSAWAYLPPGTLRYVRLQLTTGALAVPGAVVGTFALAT